MSEDLRAELEKSIDASEQSGEQNSGPVAASEPPAAPTAGPATENAATEPKTAESDAAGGRTSTAPEAGAKSAPPEPSGKAESKPEAKSETLPAPQSWKPAMRAKWSGLDPEIQAEITRREKQITKEFGVNNDARQLANTMAKVVAPYQARLNTLGLDPMRAFSELMKSDHVLSSGDSKTRARYAAKLIRDYNIDIEELDSALAGEGANPQESALERVLNQKLAPMQQFIAQQQQAMMQQRRAQTLDAESQIQAMAADHDKYPYFEDVREDMADLMELAEKRGMNITLEEAYERAVLVNPEVAPLVRQQMMNQTQTQAAQRQSQAAQAAKQASLSVQGSPTSPGVGSGNNTLRGALEAAIAQASGR